jgi:membrane-associated phospholipid phosphatase
MDCARLPVGVRIRGLGPKSRRQRVRQAIRMSVGAAILQVLLIGSANAAPSAVLRLGRVLTDDFAYVVDNAQLDVQDIVAAPCHVTGDNSVLRSPRFYLAVAGVGALWGGSFALDQTLRSHLHDMSSGDADLLQNMSYGSIGAGAALLYAYGAYSDDARARQFMLTGGEGAGVATLLDIGIKAAFGRLRPYQDGHSHTAFFRGGASFVSGDVTPVFALATGVSEYFDNEWYVAAPVYSLALLDGFGRMGHDAHWFSDVVGAALLGWGTTKLLLYLHQRHQTEPDRWRIFPLTATPASARDRLALAPTGMTVAYRW